jgi:hypothetical protein
MSEDEAPEANEEFCNYCGEPNPSCTCIPVSPSISQIVGTTNQRLPTLSEWANQQRYIAKQLGLKNVSEYLGKLCVVCSRPAKKGAHLPLCDKHKDAWSKERNRQRAKKFRDRQKQKSGIMKS